jgi:hypothetical protein
VKRVILELALVVLAAIVLSLALNSAWFKSCCQSIERAISIALLPGVLVGMAVGGGAHSAGPIHLMIGLSVEFAALYGAWRLVGRVLKRRSAAA